MLVNPFPVRLSSMLLLGVNFGFKSQVFSDGIDKIDRAGKAGRLALELQNLNPQSSPPVSDVSVAQGSGPC